MYVIGDSWSAGYLADQTRTFAQVAGATLNLSVQVNAVPGTGYEHVMVAGTQTYPERAKLITSSAKASLVLIQGSTNDSAGSLSRVRPAAIETIRVVRQKFPGTPIVLLGPGTPAEPISPNIVYDDRALLHAAEEMSVPYISMISEDWINRSNILYVIDPKTSHPTVAGDAYIGGRLAADLRAFGAR